MEKRPFIEKSTKPDDVALRKVLSAAFPFYKELIDLTKKISAEWNHSKMSGWMLKVSDHKKALFYIIPLEKSFRISLTVREEERKNLLKEKSLSNLHDELGNAKKFVEGYALQFMVSDKKSFANPVKLISRIMEMRKK